LGTIGPSALCDCGSLTRISIPASVEVIGECAFKKCEALEQCLIDESSRLMLIGQDAFAKCVSLQSFAIPRNVERIGPGCFSKCMRLSGLKFSSVDCLKKIVGDVPPLDALGTLGFNEISREFKIELDGSEVDFDFPGWSWTDEEDSHLSLMLSI
jgi:hypothetical protein